MRAAPKSFRLHIGLFGRRNVGKSSLLNALTRQAVSIVSESPGTTTDPVEKPMELLPIGPVLFIDTAGVDDVGALGEQRVERTRKIIDRADVGVIVAQGDQWGDFEQALLDEMKERRISIVVVFNKSDLAQPPAELLERLGACAPPPKTRTDTDKAPPGKTTKGPEVHSVHKVHPVHIVHTAVTQNKGLLDLREALIRVAPDEFINPPQIVGDLIPPGELVILVVPIDLEAPRGRLIQPQVQSIRDILDADAYCMVVKERELRDAIERLKRPPALVITDSQAFLKVAADTPPDVPMTSFSILFARNKGDLIDFVRGAMTIEDLRPGDRVLVAEACSHHPIGEDIGRVKIPRWLTQYVGGKLDFTHVQGHDFPDDPSPYRLVIHCGGCMWNRREMLSRMMRCRKAGVPITNYGLTIAYSLGIFDRALGPFPAAREEYLRRHRQTSP